MFREIEKSARELGFSPAFSLSPDALFDYQKAAETQRIRERLVFDPRAEWPWVRAIVMLIYPYTPYPAGERISAYYIASNKAYHATKKIAAELIAKGFHAETDKVPARAYALHNSIGVQGRNALLRIGELGSRFVISTIATDAAEPLPVCAPPTVPCHDGCTRCMDACPTHAISRDAFTAASCMRYHMDTAMHPDFVNEHLTTYLGCEVCQHACPENLRVGTMPPPGHIAAAFDIDRLLRGDTKEARTLYGRNFTSNGKLTHEAEVFAARDAGSMKKSHVIKQIPHEK